MIKKDSVFQSATRSGLTAACVVALNSTPISDVDAIRFNGRFLEETALTSITADPVFFDESAEVFDEFVTAFEDVRLDVVDDAVAASTEKTSELEIIFNGLAKNWREATGGNALTMRRYAHASYQSILALEPKKEVISLILHELQERPDRWFEALKALTKTNPAQDSKTFDETVQRWIDWGKAENYIS